MKIATHVQTNPILIITNNEVFSFSHLWRLNETFHLLNAIWKDKNLVDEEKVVQYIEEQRKLSSQKIDLIVGTLRLPVSESIRLGIFDYLIFFFLFFFLFSFFFINNLFCRGDLLLF